MCDTISFSSAVWFCFAQGLRRGRGTRSAHASLREEGGGPLLSEPARALVQERPEVGVVERHGVPESLPPERVRAGQGHHLLDGEAGGSEARPQLLRCGGGGGRARARGGSVRRPPSDPEKSRKRRRARAPL